MQLNLISIQNLKLPTTVGCGALIIWSLYAFIVSELTLHLPVFEILFLMFGISFVAMAIRITLLRRWQLLKQPWFIWVIGVVGVCGSDIAYISAVQYAPPAHVDFIDYLWPFLVILLTGFLPKEKLTLQHIIAGILGFLGVFLVITTAENNFLGFQGLPKEYLFGYLFAFIAAIIWSLYTIVTRWYQELPIEIVGIYCGIGAIITFLLHLHFEVWVTPTPSESMMLLVLGLSSGIAYLFWAYAVQKGNLKCLGLLAYFTPVFSMGLLVLTGKQEYSFSLTIACVLVMLGVFVGSMDWSRLRSGYRGCRISTGD